MSKAKSYGLVGVLAALAGAGVASQSISAQEAPPQTVPGLAALDRAPLLADASNRVPALANDADLSRARLVRTFDGRSWFMAPGVGGRVCFGGIRADTGEQGGACVTPTDLASSGIAMRTKATDGSDLSVILVPDGYDAVDVVDGTAKSVSTIEGNLLFVGQAWGATLRLTGSGRKTLLFRL